MQAHPSWHRWPKSVHCQVDAILQHYRRFGVSKAEGGRLIRSVGTWTVYRCELHRFADYFLGNGGTDLLIVADVVAAIDLYLSDYLKRAESRKLSRQTFKTILAALSCFSEAHQSYVYRHMIAEGNLNIMDLLSRYRDAAKTRLDASSQKYSRRGYRDPVALIAAIDDHRMQLMAMLQYEGGMRAEGVGAPSGRLHNPLTRESLRGYYADPITRDTIGVVCSKEKGGKRTEHYVSIETYDRLASYLHQNNVFEVSYSGYLKAINKAAQITGQFEVGKGTHGLKHNFAEERYHEAVQSGMTHEEAMQLVSLETSHYRLSETMTYTRGR
ncbi:MAG: hypothetical protein JRG71_01865 [Deltaproteobacteria bacterium]|nr:hypothetical protein [Deltaproteobacteria bacterium]